MKKFILTLFFSLILCQFCGAFTSKSLQVRLHDGKIIGRFMRSTSGKPIRAFMGIPYAAPPVGDLRFKGPQPVEPWFHKILYAQKEPPKCSQIDTFLPDAKFEGQEDCLYLNVYTPVSAANITDSKKRLPVLVWLHGGGFLSGHSGHTLYGPEHFLDHDVVLVAGNYRLGPIGFLSTEDENSPGNFGLKDQMAILEWVQQNIEKFGGDGKSVTIFGESAGGASVNYHMISPLSKGLFHKAISQSGTLMSSWADPARKGLAKMRAIRLADMMGCSISGTSMKEIIKCLREVPAEKITMAVLKFQEIDGEPVVPFPPVVEDFAIEEEEPFITDLRFRKHSLDIPWLTGITSEEGLLKTASILSNDKKKKLITREWEKLLPLTFNYDHLHEDEILEMNVKIYDFYFKDKFMDIEDEGKLTNLWSDGWFLSGFFENLEFRLRDNNRDNTFVYLMSHKGYASISELLGGGEKFYGTCHVDDLNYLFPPPQEYVSFLSAIPSKEDERLRKNWIKLWVNFARTGHPTPEWSSESKFPFWTPASKFPLDFMLIGNENGNSKEIFKIKKDLYPERAKFWMDLKEKFNLKVWKTESKPKEGLKEVEKDEL